MKKMMAFCSARVKNNNFWTKDGADYPDSYNFLRPLAEALAHKGWACQSSDTAPAEQCDTALFVDMPPVDDPYLLAMRRLNRPCFLVILENYLLKSRNRDYRRYDEFAKVFSYDDDAVAQGIAIKTNYVHPLPIAIETEDISQKTKLACMIFSNSKRTRPRMAYHHRLQTIDFFEKKHPEDFDLYGHDWNRGTEIFQTRHPCLHYRLRHLLLPRFKRTSWRGMVTGKAAIFARYRFGFCYENCIEIPGYITEKIFDVMMAGSVPVYLGHPATRNHIPTECYIDRAAFASEAEMYDFLKTMPDEMYRKYLRAINAFLSSPASHTFSFEGFVATVVGVL